MNIVSVVIIASNNIMNTGINTHTVMIMAYLVAKKIMVINW